MSARLIYLWHRVRGHRAYWLTWGGACNTCDVDFPRSRIGKWWS